MENPMPIRVIRRKPGPARRFDRQRILDLRAVGLTLVDIATLVGCSVGTCWQVVHPEYALPGRRAKEAGKPLRDANNQEACDGRSAL